MLNAKNKKEDPNLKKEMKLSNKKIQKLIDNFFKNTFGNLDKQQLSKIYQSIKIKKIRKILEINQNSLNEDKKMSFLVNNYCFILDKVAFFVLENNYKKIIIEMFYPNSYLNLDLLRIFPDGFLLIPRNSLILAIPTNLTSIEINQQKDKRDYYVEILNYKSLDSINRLLYFLYSYATKNTTKSNELIIKNKKLISYIIGNSHEVIVRNFKKIQKMNYIYIENGKIKINLPRLEQWIKNSKIIV